MGLFDFFEDEYQQGYRLGQALRNNPTFAKRYYEQEDRKARNQYLNGLMGDEEIPAQYEMQTQQVEGPMLPGQERGYHQINQQITHAKEGTGYLGGKISDKELALRMMMAPTSPTRSTGSNILQKLISTPTAPTQTAIQKNLAAAGMTPGTDQYQQALMNYIMKPATQITMGNIPAGYERKSVSGGTVLAPQVGSKDYTNAMEGYQQAGQSINNVNNMIELIRKHGTESYGKVSGKMGTLYGQILAVVAELQNKGVLQQGELEMIQKQLTDPSKVESLGTANETMIAQYETLLNLLQDKQKMLSQKFKQWGHKLPTNLTPTEAQRLKELEAQGKREGWLK